jgi:hypothetical protein
MKVYIITRFGICQSLESFYEREIVYLENFLAKSINVQKKYITKWIILIDINTPHYICEKIKKLAPPDLLHIHIHDPFLEKATRPNIKKVFQNIGVKANDKIIEIRIDADDVFSNDYIINVLNVLKKSNFVRKYEKVLIDTPEGMYFYPSKKKFIRVRKKNYSIQALYSIFNQNFFSSYDYGHQKLENRVIESGGYCYNLDNKPFWVRTMRHYTISQFGKTTSIFDGRFILIKQIVKEIFFNNLTNKMIYKNEIRLSDISGRFQFSNKIIDKLKKHEQAVKKYNFKFSSKLKKIINNKSIKSAFVLKKVLLDMYCSEQSERKKSEIVKDFYSF